jgi:pilus assembly protein CpaF
MTETLLRLAYQHHEIAELDEAARRLALRELAIGAEEAELGTTVAQAAAAIDGYGAVSELMEDPSVTDILINGPTEVWTERDGRLERTEICFAEPRSLYALINRLLSDGGAAADRSNPIADARLRDGSRLHVVLPPAAPDGPLVSIRRFPRDRWSLDELIELQMLEGADADLLRELVAQRRTLAISGGTGTGKTTLLNALLGLIGPTERVVVIEETSELRPTCPHAVSLVTNDPNVEGIGRVDADDLLRAALRMRPDRIVVGEVRGPEAFVALQAMSTGHPGSMVTLHADRPAIARERMARLALQASPGSSEGSLRESVERCFDVVVQLARSGGRRRVETIELR